MMHDTSTPAPGRSAAASPRGRAAAAAAFLVVAAWMAAAGCSSSPPVRLYSLQSPEPAAPARDGLQPVWISVAPVGVPAQVDQPEWLVRAPDDSLRLLEQTRWAAPLRSELRASLVDALQSRWAASDAQQGVPAGAVVWRVVVDVQRFESLPGVEARLEARWSISSPGTDAAGKGYAPGPVASCHGRWREPASGDLNALAEAHRANVRKLADVVGAAVQAAAGGAPASCGDAGAAAAAG